MATEAYYDCKCQKRGYPWTLFDALFEFAHAVPQCETCGNRKALHLVLSADLSEP